MKKLCFNLSNLISSVWLYYFIFLLNGVLVKGMYFVYYFYKLILYKLLYKQSYYNYKLNVFIILWFYMCIHELFILKTILFRITQRDCENKIMPKKLIFLPFCLYMQQKVILIKCE
jgi:hypothetical protein